MIHQAGFLPGLQVFLSKFGLNFIKIRKKISKYSRNSVKFGGFDGLII